MSTIANLTLDTVSDTNDLFSVYQLDGSYASWSFIPAAATSLSTQTVALKRTHAPNFQLGSVHKDRVIVRQPVLDADGIPYPKGASFDGTFTIPNAMTVAEQADFVARVENVLQDALVQAQIRSNDLIRS
jgi:hypothetical protein